MVQFTIHTQLALNDVVAGQGNATSADFSMSSLVDEVSHTLQVGVSPCNVRFTDSKHVQGSLNETAIVELNSTFTS